MAQVCRDSSNIERIEKPLRLLSLDGGGVRGLSSLYILQDIMTKIKFQRGFNREPLPCDYFDIICGTSTGGIIAVMLGRLRMSSTQCIAAYQKLSGAVFGQKQSWYKHTTYSGAKLEEILKGVVEDWTGDKETILIDDLNECKIFVTATRKLAMGEEPILIRSYNSPIAPIQCTIAQAARATSAAPTFFPAIRIGDEEYLDGGLGNNNPAMIAIQEGQTLWRNASYSNTLPTILVSLGTGKQEPVQLEDGGLLSNLRERSGINCANALAKMITSSETAHRHVSTWMKERNLGDRYFRFNVTHGLSSVSLDSHSKLMLITSSTKSYLQQEVPDEVLNCAKILLEAQYSPEFMETYNQQGTQSTSPADRAQNCGHQLAQDGQSTSEIPSATGTRPTAENEPSLGSQPAAENQYPGNQSENRSSHQPFTSNISYNTNIAGRNITTIGNVGFARFG